MRIAILHYTAPPVKGGAESVIQQQAQLMAEHGHEVTIFAGRGRQNGPQISPTPSARTAAKAQLRGSPPAPPITFRRLPLLAATHPTQRRLAVQLAEGTVPNDLDTVTDSLLSGLRRALVGQDAILVHNAFTLHFNIALTIALRTLAEEEFRERTVAWTHDIAAINPLYEAELHSGFPWDILSRPQTGVRYVTVSKTRRQELLQLWEKQRVSATPEVHVIPNGIDPTVTLALNPTMQEISRRLRLFDRKIVLLMPVRITRRKNIELAIEVVAALADSNEDAILLVTGPMRGHHPARSRVYVSELHRRAEELGLGDKVIFLTEMIGRALTDKEIAGVYAASTVLFMPSRSEGFGLPILEAAAHRLPIVAADIPVFHELAGESATYFDANTPAEEVASLVEKAVSSSVNELRTRALRTFAWDTIYSREIAPLLDQMQESRPVSQGIQ